MAEPSVTETLRQVVQVDIDAISAYTQAIEFCNDEAVAEMLTGFRSDHQRHVDELSTAIRERGGAAPESSDVTGFAIAGFTAVSSSAGTMGALTIMESNEIVTNDAYDKALASDLPAELRTMLERNRADERRHLDLIRARLESMPGGRAMSHAARMQGTVTSAWVNTLRENLPAALLLGAGAAWMLGGMLSRPRGGEQRESTRTTHPGSPLRH